jgi:hypothetical protein
VRQSKYEWPDQIGDTAVFPLDLYEERALRTSATTQGTRYGRWLKVTKKGLALVVTRVDGPPQTPSKRVIDADKVMVALGALTRSVRELKSEIKQVREQLDSFEEILGGRR